MWEPALLCLNSYREWYCLQYMVLQIPQINIFSTSPHHPHHVPTSVVYSLPEACRRDLCDVDGICVDICVNCDTFYLMSTWWFNTILGTRKHLNERKTLITPAVVKCHLRSPEVNVSKPCYFKSKA